MMLHGLCCRCRSNPLFENALRARRGRYTPAEHLAGAGRALCALSERRRANPTRGSAPRAAPPTSGASASRIASSLPYPNADERDHGRRPGPAVLMTVGRPGACGSACRKERWLSAGLRRRARSMVVSERRDYTSSPAIARRQSERWRCRREHRGHRPVRPLQLLSDACSFAQSALGPADDDPRPLTVTAAWPVRRSGQQLLDARHRQHARSLAGGARAAWAGHGARLVRDQARDRHLRHEPGPLAWRAAASPTRRCRGASTRCRTQSLRHAPRATRRSRPTP